MTPPESTSTIPEVRAVFTADSIRVYQAYSDEIADAALNCGTFSTPYFHLDRMTWIKPSFLWMMCRASWGQRDEKQKRILAIDISRQGFEWALSNSRMTAHGAHAPPCRQDISKLSPVLIQWDPEKNILCRRLNYRSIQVGLRGEAIRLYVTDWIRKITDITTVADQIGNLVLAGEQEIAAEFLPVEMPYPLSSDLRYQLGIAPA